MDEKTDPSDRVLSDLFAPPKASPSPEPEKRSRGRPAGSKAQLLAPTTSLHLEDFFFLRAVINGLKAGEAYERYYSHVESDAQGRLPIPHANTLIARARRLINEVVNQARNRPNDNLEQLAVQLQAPLPEVTATAKEQARATMKFEDWAEQHADMWGENELAERYQDYLRDSGASEQVTAEINAATEQLLSRTRALQAKLRALNALQTELARRPAPEQDIGLWLDHKIVSALREQGANTLHTLVKYIGVEGKHWHRNLKGIGLGRARRIEQWLDFHVETLPRIDRNLPQWQRHKYATIKTTLPSAALTLDAHSGQVQPSPALSLRFAIVPLEALAVPPDLDGSRGTFRSPNPNQYGASTDLQAIKGYLSSFLSAGKHKAFEAYRREIERFYLWCLITARIPLSSATLAHAQAYQLFLQKIPHQWIYAKPIERSNPAWKPFRGQLAPKNQNYALGILKQLFRKLIENGYLTSSPFASIQKTAQVSTGFSIDTSRAFNAQEMDQIRQALETLPGLQSEKLLTAAKARRMRLLIELCLTTGLRRSEACNASLKTMATAHMKELNAEAHTIQIVGKGKKARTVTLSSRLLERIHEHHEDFRKLRGDNPALLEDLALTQPLILALEAPVNQSEQTQAPRAGLSSSGLYRVFKSFMAHIDGHDRLSKATPHWMRHTFAHAILDNNYKGKGLPLTQRLLGHSSLSTTGQYVEQDNTDLILASRLASLF